MTRSYERIGTLSDGRIVELDDPLPLSDGKVKITVEPVSEDIHPLLEVLAEIRREQAASGYVPPTAEEVNRYLEEERAGWDR